MDSRKLKDKATEAFTKGKFARAGEFYAQYCEADPSDLHARLRMGDAWAKAGQKGKAIVAYQWAAEGFAKDGFLPRAIAASKLILELDPAHKGVQQMLAELYARKNAPLPRQGPGAVLAAAARPAARAAAAEAPRPAPPPPGDGGLARAPGQASPASIALGALAPGRPAAPEPPSPMTRKDAIDLPPEAPPAPSAPSPQEVAQAAAFARRTDAIAIEVEESAPADRAAPTEVSIDLELPAPAAPPAPEEIAIDVRERVATGEVEIPIADGTELPAPAPAAAVAPPPPPAPAPAAEPPRAEAYELDVNDTETLESYAASLRSSPPAAPPAPAPSAPTYELTVEDVPGPATPQAPPAVAPAPPPAAPSGPPGLRPRRTSEPAVPGALVVEPATPLPEAAVHVGGYTGPLPPAIAPLQYSPTTPQTDAPAQERGGLTDLERSLEVFSKFDVDAPAAPAAAPPPAALTGGFTELELEGESLLHAVEAAAQAGSAARGEAAPLEEPMEAPEDARPLAPGELPKIPLFSDLPEGAFIALFERCPLRRFEPGELVIEQGSIGDAFYVVCGGSVKVSRTEHGRRRELATLEEGAFFGEMALLSDAPRSASVEAASPDTQLLEITAQVLADLSKSHPLVASALKKFCRQRMLANIMRTAPLFQPFSGSDRKELVQRFRARDVHKGEVLIREGQRSDGMYVVLSGEVDVTVGAQRVAQLKEGDLFGEMSLLTKAPAAATVTSTRRTSLLRLPREDFDQLILSHPQILVLVSDLTDERKRRNASLAQGGGDGGAGVAPMV